MTGRAMNSTQGQRAGVATIWFVTAAEPLAVLTAEPDHDRGFGRKYLALLDPRLTVTPIGDFPLNRSAPAGAGEFYIGGFDGLAVVQTVLDDVSRLSAFFFVQPPMESRITAVSTNIIILFTSSLLYNIVERYTHIKGSALSHHTVSLYSSPMHKNRASCNGKSQTCTANLSRMRLVHAIKSLIDVL